MGKIYFLNYRFILVLTAVLVTACQEKDSDRDGLNDKIDRCPLVAAKTKNGCPVPKEIAKVHLFLDNSASMGGYFAGKTEYKTIVSDLANKIDRQIRPIDISFIGNTIFKYQKDISHFSSDIATTKIAYQNSSQLHWMVDQIATRTGKNDVSLMISDCILSFPDSAIKANPEVNKTDAVVLQNNIYRTFIDLRKKGFGASIYAFESNFNGIYYNYQNAHIRLNGIYRPFYILVIAKKDILAVFDAKIADISSFKPEQSLHFGMTDSAVTRYHILPQLGRAGDWKKIPSPLVSGDQGLQDIGITKGQPVMFNIALDLSALPPYARELSYLKKNLQVLNKGCSATALFKIKSDVNTDKVKSLDQLVSLENATHFLEVRVPEIRLPSARLQLILPVKYDTWYSDWSSADDKAVKTQPHQTFDFNYLFDGLRQAYETKNTNYINLTINLNQ